MNGPLGEANGGIEEGAHTFPLDATMIDVYSNAHAAIFCVDPSKKWTYEYVLREIEKVPTHLPVAICLNFRDYPASKRILHIDDVEQEVARLFSETRPIRPFVFETSMLNNFGVESVEHVFTRPAFVFETHEFRESVETEYVAHSSSARGVEDDENVELVRATPEKD